MFKTLSKLYRDLLHQNIELHNENTKLRLLLQDKERQLQYEMAMSERRRRILLEYRY